MICLCIVALELTLCCIGLSHLCVVANHLYLISFLLFMGVPLLFVFLLLSVGLCSFIHVYSVCAYTSVHMHVNACTYALFVVSMLQPQIDQ